MSGVRAASVDVMSLGSTHFGCTPTVEWKVGDVRYMAVFVDGDWRMIGPESAPKDE